VFLGKLEVFSAAVDGGYAWLAVVAVANTVASLFYYLRWIAPAVTGAPATAARRWSATGAAVAYGTAAASLVLGVVSEPVLNAVSTRMTP
jgi:NADH-quinone oxidoreductase subunit N